jgi:hypothetical protein
MHEKEMQEEMQEIKLRLQKKSKKTRKRRSGISEKARRNGREDSLAANKTTAATAA